MPNFFYFFIFFFQRCKVLTAKQLLTGQDGPPENSPKAFLIYGWLTQQGLYNFTEKSFLPLPMLSNPYILVGVPLFLYLSNFF